MRTKDFKSSKGITLIALVVTIIVLLILAGVSISMLTGDNGILTNAQQTSTQSAYKGAEEQVKLAYMAVKTEIMAKTVEDGKYNPKENTKKLANIVRKDFGLAEDDVNGNGTWKVVEDIQDGVIKIEYKDSKIDQGVIGTVNLTQLDGQVSPTVVPRKEGVVHYQINLLDTQDAKLFVDTADDLEVVYLAENSSLVGQYADINGDGVIDGIIFADLAIGNTNHLGDDGKRGKGLKQEYSIPVETGLKKYQIERTNEATPREYIKVASNIGKDRFYVVALKNADNMPHTWYSNAGGYMNASDISTSFGSGKANTEIMIKKGIEGTNSTGYRELSSTDVWYFLMSDLESKQWTTNMKQWWQNSNEMGKYKAVTEHPNGETVGNSTHLWGYVKEGWFVPSIEECAAMDGELSLIDGALTKASLPNYFWSSSQFNENFSWYAHIVLGLLDISSPASSFDIRLVTTF